MNKEPTEVNENEVMNEKIEIENFARLLAFDVASLHNINLVHGDLTTSNLLITQNIFSIYIKRIKINPIKKSNGFYMQKEMNQNIHHII